MTPSILNFTAADSPIGALGLINTATTNQLSIYNAATGTTDVVLDANGYFA
jgi:hypothetical protein